MNLEYPEDECREESDPIDTIELPENSISVTVKMDDWVDGSMQDEQKATGAKEKEAFHIVGGDDPGEELEDA